MDEVGAVRALRQRYDAHRQVARPNARGAQHRLLAGAVGVEGERHLRGQAGQLADLLLGQRRPCEADRVARRPAWCIAITSV